MDLLIVSDSADRLAIETVELAQEQGRTAAILDVLEAAQLFSIGIDGNQVVVTPEIPLFLRLPAPSMLRKSFDAEFQLSEGLATLWAAAALTHAPVINRPRIDTLSGYVSSSAVLTELRAGITTRALEIFSSEALPPPVPSVQSWYLQDVVTHCTTPWPKLPEGQGPYRARYADIEPAYEAVVVLESQSWRCTMAPLEHLALEEKSVHVIHKLGLSFGAVIWSIPYDLSHGVLVYVDPFPPMNVVKFVWLGLGPALLEAFFV